MKDDKTGFKLHFIVLNIDTIDCVKNLKDSHCITKYRQYAEEFDIRSMTLVIWKGADWGLLENTR